MTKNNELKETGSGSDVNPVSDSMVNLLRDIRNQDPEAFAALVSWRTSVNEKLATHPLIQIATVRGKPHLSFIGLLNGLLVAIDAQKIASIVDNDTVVGFTLMERDHSIPKIMTQVQPMTGGAGD